MPQPSTNIRERKKLDSLYGQGYKEAGSDMFAKNKLWAEYRRDKNSMNKRLYSRGYISVWKDKYKPDVPIEGEGFRFRYDTSRYY